MTTDQQYKALVTETVNGPLLLKDLPLNDPIDNEVQIKVLACGICLGDQVGRVIGKKPIVSGHEVVGIITKLGKNVESMQSHLNDNDPWKFKINSKVGLGWFSGHCGGQCFNCRKGNQTGCSLANATGLSRDGGWAEFVHARPSALCPWPDDLPVEQAPMMCAGLTVFNAVRNSHACKPGANVAVLGMGGLGTIAIPIIRAFGMNPIVISGSPQKKEKSLQLGAEAYIDRNSPSLINEVIETVDNSYGGSGPGGVDLVLTTSPDVKTVNLLLNGAIAMDGEVILLSEPEGDKLTVDIIPLLMKRASIKGWSAGAAKDAYDCIKFIQKNKILNIVEKIKLEDAPHYFENIGTNVGRAVIVF